MLLVARTAIPVEHNGLAFTMNIAEGPLTTYCRLGGRRERRTGSHEDRLPNRGRAPPGAFELTARPDG